ncbi:MAG: hypothetical protein ACNA8W_20970 [Bradymonadaceae bacterium]
MTDPISGQLAAQALQQPATTQGIDGPGQGPSPGGASFKDVMTEQTQAAGGVDGPGEAQAVQEVQAPEVAERVEQAQLDDFIDGILANEKDLKRMMEQCMNGGAMGQQEMLQMQALIYSYSQKVDLTTKVVEKATGGLKQVMNTQV